MSTVGAFRGASALENIGWELMVKWTKPHTTKAHDAEKDGALGNDVAGHVG